ncbi:MAG: carboxypeptidase regulatory-like domain-containing protein [Elusimicrobia bacterium]|nr:carboxypeptidase regulatory-like domain-containing protein [Candidatus Liberimonas magnetica]
MKLSKVYIASDFKKSYNLLPSNVQTLVDKRDLWFKENPHDARLKTHYMKTNFTNKPIRTQLFPVLLFLFAVFFFHLIQLQAANKPNNDISKLTIDNTGIVGSWSFNEESGSIAHDSVGNSNGTIYGASWVNGKKDGALSFDGVNDYIDLGAPAVLDLPGDLTLESFCKPILSGLWAHPPFTVKFASPYDRNYDGYICRDGSGAFGYYSSGHQGVNLPSGTFKDNVWQHMAMVYSWDGSIATISFYIDGLLKTQATTSAQRLTNAATKVSIGSEGIPGFYFFNGVIDEVNIYNRALSAQEILDRYNLLNTIPVLSYTGETHYTNSFVYPEVGKTSTTYTFRVNYTHIGSSAPAANYPLLRIYKGGTELSNSPFAMKASEITDLNYADGKIYASTVTLKSAASNYTYKISAYDVSGTSATEVTGSGPVVETLLMTGNLIGKVTKSDGTTAVSGALVEALQAGVVRSNATTGANGNYSIVIETGTYDVKASLTGYYSHTTTGYNIGIGSTVTVNFALPVVIQSQTGTPTITTVAGNGTQGYSGDSGIAASAQLYYPCEVAVDASGNVYISDFSNFRIRKVDTSGLMSTFAGNGTAGYSGDGGPATAAQINYSAGIAVDASGNVYIADTNNYRIRKVNASGIISTFAGTGTSGFSGDGGLAASAQLNTPNGVAVDASGNVYIADNTRVRKVNTSGIISTIAGNGSVGYSGDGGPATLAQINHSYGVAVDASGNVYIADSNVGDSNYNRIRKVNASGIISTFAGNGTLGYSGDGGLAASANLSGADGVAVDASGNVYIADNWNNRIRKVNTLGIISTFAGNGVQGYSGDSGSATSAKLNYPDGVTVDTSGNVYIADQYNNRIRKVYFVQKGIISGKLTKADRTTAISGALVEILKSNVVRSTATSDASGNYSITIGTGTYDVKATLSGYQSQTKTDYSVSNGSTITVNFSLTQISQAKKGIISGKVTKSDGTTAVSVVLVEALQSGITKSSIMTDNSGNYSITIGTGAYDVKASATGYLSQTKTGYNVTAGSTNTVSFSLVDLSAAKYGVISGKVNKSDGTTAISGIVVEVLKSGIAKSNATTDISGNYSITIGTGTYDVKASATGYLSQTKTGYNVTAGSTNTVSFSLVDLSATKSGVISGKVTKTNGTTAISGAAVEVLKSGVLKSNATTDISGNYLITIETGTYDVRTSLSGYQAQLKTGYTVTNGSTVTINFSLTEVSVSQTGTLSCTITTSTGTAIVNALIKIYQGSTLVSEEYSDSLGKYSFSLGAGSYDITVSKTGYQTATQKGVSVSAGMTSSASFSLAQSVVAQTGTLSCNVQCNGVVENAVIRITQNNNLIDMEQTDSLGVYSFSLAVGAYDINVSKTGYQTSTQTGVVVSYNQTTNVYISLLQSTQAKPQADKQTTLGNNLFSPSSGGTCKIGFNVPQSGGITIKICDLKGRQVRSAFDNTSYTAGSYQWNWDGKDDSGKPVPPGMYILYFKYPGGTETRKIGIK